jgi:phosphosulfolactate phosphohydrolase-like enzyme
MSREQKTRAVLAETGVSPESAAVTLKAVKEALLKCMPGREADAAGAATLFQVAVVPSQTTGQHALRDLLAAGAIQRAGTGARGNPFRYFKRFKAIEERTSRGRGE